jgi:hypothetical protein
VGGTESRTGRWWPEVRRIDVIGVVLFLGFIGWVWWASRAADGAGGTLIALLVGMALLATATRWATFFHGTGPAALLAVVLIAYGLAAGDGSDGLGTERLGALLTIGTGAAAVVAVRADRLWLRIIGGGATLALALLTWRTGSLTSTLVVAFVVGATVALLVLPMRERRWVIVWPALVAVFVLLGTVTYASLGIPSDAGLGGIDPDRVAAWEVALDAVSAEPLAGIGRGRVPRGVEVDETGGWARHEPLQLTAETGVVGGLLLIGLLWWALVWVARPGGGPGSVIAGVVIAGSVAHACLEPIWHAPIVPLALAVLAGAASMRGGDARWRIDELLVRARGSTTGADPRSDDARPASSASSE